MPYIPKGINSCMTYTSMDELRTTLHYVIIIILYGRTCIIECEIVYLHHFDVWWADRRYFAGTRSTSAEPAFTSVVRVAVNCKEHVESLRCVRSAELSSVERCQHVVDASSTHGSFTVSINHVHLTMPTFY
eukprot:GHVO01004633.1.p1 GENE.GHVO01004633.1~~GHVO01004633.1.p1  ORF type:complete len:131 (-),score=4.28 GHVO01004633.1:159-551(-)